MSWTLLKMANKARGLPEVAIVLRIALGVAGVIVLLPVVSSLRSPGEVAGTEYVGLALFLAVAVWLFRAALRK